MYEYLLIAALDYIFIDSLFFVFLLLEAVFVMYVNGINNVNT